jgi:hypothetical protein
MSALLAVRTGLCMTRGRTVGFVCSGWGSVAAVDGPGSWATIVSSLRTAVSTAHAVAGGTEGVEVFRNFSHFKEASGQLWGRARTFEASTGHSTHRGRAAVSAWSAVESGWSAL